MDQRVDQILPLDKRGLYPAALTTPQSKARALPCVVSGYPVLKNKVDFKRSGFVANKEDWNNFVIATKVQYSSCSNLIC